MYEDARRCSRMCDRLTSCSTNLAKRVVKDMIYLPVDSYLVVVSETNKPFYKLLM